ncbi:uncharacterized protein LOC141941783 [Strix uralensis]|uniref:uncharacterized protein LOC141941783 n=1 Tax=Strix uralensis TaxID=36305 RepID=UPI003DA7289A
MLKMCSLPGVSGREHQGRPKADPCGFGVRDTEDLRTAVLQLKEILAAYEGVRAASEVVGTETQLLLAPRLSVLGWMFRGSVPSTHHATDATWSKWVALITQRVFIGNPSHPGISEVITNCPEGKDFGMSPEEEENIDGGRLLCGAPHDELQKLLKEKVNRVSSQRRKPSSWPRISLSEKSGQCSTSILTGGKCAVGVVTAVETEQLAAQRQTHLGC